MTWRQHTPLLATALLLTLLPTLAAAGPPSQGAEVHPLVWETLRAEGSAEVLLVLRAQADLSGAEALPTKAAKGRYVYGALRAVAEESQRGLRAALDAQGADYRAFYIVNAIAVQADNALVRSLAARTDVARILPNPWVRGAPPAPTPAADRSPGGIEPNLARAHAPEVWALGYSGQGVVVAGQDTGYDWDHPALKNQYRGWDSASATASHDYNWHDAIHSGGGVCGADSPEPCDDHGHGTHTMGTAVGDDAPSGGGGGSNQIGMAPGARWIGCRNMDEGWGAPSTYLECFEFFLAPYPLDGAPAQGDPDLAPHVINNSWSCPPSEGCAPDTLEAAVEAVRQAGIVVVVSAGNEGSACSTVSDPPALYQQSFAVGAFNYSTDQIAGFSSRGPVSYGGDSYTKPDIAAPGVNIRSSVPGGGYAGGWQGTSMAAPHVAGAVALLLSAAPAYAGDVDAIERLLTRAAAPRTTSQGCGGDGPTDVPNNVWGWGILDALAAVESVTTGALQGAVTDADSAAPLASATVSVKLPTGFDGPRVLSGATGQYSLALAPGSYDLTVDAVGYVAQTVAAVSVVSGTVTVQDFALEPARLFFLPLVVKGE